MHRGTPSSPSLTPAAKPGELEREKKEGKKNLEAPGTLKKSFKNKNGDAGYRSPYLSRSSIITYLHPQIQLKDQRNRDINSQPNKT
jgi:hypothetical protein